MLGGHFHYHRLAEVFEASRYGHGDTEVVCLLSTGVARGDKGQ